jgi:hypothetical protein
MNSVTKTIRKWAAFKRLRTVVASMSLFVCLLPSVVNSQDIFFNPGLDQQSINPNSIAGGPVLWLQARPEYFGTTGARTFDGEQYVALDSAITAPGTSDFWVSLWFKSSATGNTQYILVWGATNDTNPGIRLHLDTGDDLWLSFSDGTDRETVQLEGSLVDGEWHYCVLQFDRDGNMSIRLDADENTATASISSLTASVTPTAKLLGATSNSFHGDLSKIAYGTGLLTTDEIAELYNSGNGITRAMYSAGLAAKTVHSWNCNEAPEATLYDSTGSNHGTPSLPGTELVSNGGFEDRTGDDFDDWTESPSGSSTVNAETSDVQAGSVSCRLDVVDGASVHVGQNILTSGHVYSVTVQAKGSASGPLLRGVFGSASGSCSVTETWGECILSGTSDSTLFRLQRNVGGTYSIYLDSVSVVRTGPHVGSTAGPEATNVTDSVGSNNGLAVNMDVSNVSNDIPTALAGTGVKSLSFDGVEELVEVANDDSLRIADTVTLSCWFKTTDDTSRMTLLTKRYNEYELAIESNNKALAWYGDAGEYDDLVRDSIPAYANGAWHHVTAAIDKANGTLDVVFDGVAQTQVTGGVDRSGTQGTNVLTVGMRSGVSNEFTGSLCDCRVYNKLLSTAESQSLAAGTDVTDGLVSRWKFDDQWNTPPGDGEPIASWTCRATGAVFTQDTAASRPIYRAPGSAIGNAFGGLEFDGTDDLLVRTVANWLGSSSGGFIVAVIKPGDTGINTLFSTADEALTIKYLRLVTTGTSKINQRNADTLDNVRTGATDITAAPYIVAWDSSGTAYTGFVQGDAKSLTVDEGANSGDWFADTADRDNVTVGALKNSSEVGHFNGIISEIQVYDGTVSAGERTRLFQRLQAEYSIAP